MKNCDNCIHCPVCEIKDVAFKGCKLFLHESRINLQTPCDVGDELYYVYADNVFRATVSMLQKKKDKTWKIRISTKFGVCDFTEEEIGKSLFFTRAEAEKHLED